MIGHEAALHYAQEGNHFETRCVLTIACRRTSPVQTRLGGAFISGAPDGGDREREREWFKQQLQEFVDAISPVWKLAPLDLSALLSHITSCINGRMCQVKAPRASGAARRGAGQSGLRSGLQAARRRTAHPRGLAGGLSVLLARRAGAVSGGTAAVPIAIRSARFRSGSGLRVGQLGVLRRNWFQKRKGARAMLSESIGSGAGAAFENQHALRMAADADDAIAEAEGGEVRFCYVTPKIVLTGGYRRRGR